MVAKPRIAKLLHSIVVAEQKRFQYSVSDAFSPLDGSLNYRLETEADWLVIDSTTGVITGMTPKLHQSHKQFLVTVIAFNETEEISQSFFIKVVRSDMINNIEDFFYKLSLFPFLLDRRQHEVLEFIFEYYHSSKFFYDFIHLLREHAEALDIKLGEVVEYEDFKRVVEAAHPGIEKELEQRLAEDFILTEAELTRTEMARLFKEGAQPLGVVPIVVWNYIAEASYHNWSELKTVLHAAVEAIREMHHHVSVSERRQLKFELRPKQ